MKKHFTTLFLFAATIMTAFTLSGCGEEVDINPDDIERIKGRTEFFTEGKKSVGDDGTRTSTDEDRYFYWTVGDKIWVEQSTDNWIQSLSNTITAVQPSAKFYFNEPLPEETYNIRYTGFGNTSAKSVTVQPTQTQSAWKNGDHIATSGDCGIATATHQGDRKYKFSLAHKAAYVILYPYMVSSIPTHYTLDRTYTLMKVEVTSSDNAEIAGTFNFGSTGITGAATSNASNMITLNCSTSGFALENNSNPSKNYLVVVMRPVELNRLTFTYYVKDNTDGTVFTYPVSPGIRTYSPNGFTVLTHMIPDMVYHMPTYYKWGSGEAYSPNGNYSTWLAPSDVSAYFPWQYAPNINQACWYASTAIVNDYIRWRIQGQSTVYNNGVWMKKWSYIVSENGGSLTQDPNGTDWRTAANQEYLRTNNTDAYRTDRPNNGSPVESLQWKYFYLPDFGHYNIAAPAVLNSFGYTAYYWTRTAGSTDYFAPRFAASSTTVNVNLQSRQMGFVVGQGWFQ